MIRKFMLGLAATGGSLMAAGAAWAQEAAAPAAEAVVDKGDTAWMLTSTLLVLLMVLPGLALFYGGLTRTKNMLSTMTQIGAAACLAMVIWVAYGYGLTFGPEGNAVIAWGKWFLAGVTPDSLADTFSDGFKLPEYVFVSFQMTFAAITIALVWDRWWNA